MSNDETSAPSPNCWLYEGVEIRSSGIEGGGLFALQNLAAGTIVERLGGRLISQEELDRLISAAEQEPGHPYIDSITVDDGVNLLLPAGQANHFGNHSCDPNLWHTDAFTIAARRDIRAGEELTIDYSTQTANPDFRMECHCGSDRCRGVVTGDDWRLPELRERYGEHWVPALQRKIMSD
jgi:SET domain-containing protein